MSKLKQTAAFVVCLWYAENTDKNNFFMLLKQHPERWQLDWRFVLEGVRGKQQVAFSGLQVKEKQVIHEGNEIFQLTAKAYPLRRLRNLLIGGDEFKLRIILRQMKLVW